MTVKDLKEILSNYDLDTEIVILDSDCIQEPFYCEFIEPIEPTPDDNWIIISI